MGLMVGWRASQEDFRRSAAVQHCGSRHRSRGRSNGSKRFESVLMEWSSPACAAHVSKLQLGLLLKKWGGLEGLLPHVTTCIPDTPQAENWVSLKNVKSCTQEECKMLGLAACKDRALLSLASTVWSADSPPAHASKAVASIRCCPPEYLVLSSSHTSGWLTLLSPQWLSSPVSWGRICPY